MQAINKCVLSLKDGGLRLVGHLLSGVSLGEKVYVVNLQNSREIRTSEILEILQVKYNGDNVTIDFRTKNNTYRLEVVSDESTLC